MPKDPGGALAQTIRAEAEGKDICARYGGDGFAFAMLAESSALYEPESIRTRTETTAGKLCNSKEYRISASLGACSCPVRERASPDQLLAEADRALYSDRLRRRR